MHKDKHLSKLFKLYSSDLYILLKVNYTPVKLEVGWEAPPGSTEQV